MFDVIKELGLSGWSAVAGIAVICVSFVSWWHGEWPWQGLIVHNHNCKCNHDEDEEED